MRRHLLLSFWLALLCSCLPARAGVLTRPELVKRFPAPLVVGDKQTDLPIWPLFKQNATATELVGYVFESIDLAPVPGFAGVPINLLVAIDPKGSFLDVAVLSHHEPVFLDGLGEAPLFAFVAQYQELSLKQNIVIDSKTKRLRGPDAGHAYLDGVSKATASVRIIHQSVLSAALKVSRKKLGFGEGSDPDQIARIRADMFEPMSVAQLLDAGLVRHLRVTNRDVEKLFAGSTGAGLDAGALAHPNAVFIDLYLAVASVPTAGRNVLTAASWKKLHDRLEAGDHALLVMSSGRYSILADDFVRGSVPDRLVLKQDKLPIDMRDLDLELALAATGPLPAASVTVLRVIGQAGLDPARPFDFTLPITRFKGIVYPERITRDIAFSVQVPAQFTVAPEASNKSWPGIWSSRRAELLVLAAALAVLSAALLLQKRLTAHGARFAWFRAGFLLFTIGFIGYYAQGQLSIVNLTGVLQALLAHRSLAFMMFDPMTVVLWGFTAVSLLVWGRGTFCGWLCPFGALQEATGKLAQWIKLPQLRIRPRSDARLKLIKYPLLAMILASAWLAPALTDKLVEFEPFKTAITLNFVRSWPYVAYAVALLLASMFVYKFFCRYLCPFGAALALLGRFRVLDWIPRRAECGAPCQTCRHRCDYQAITPAGDVSYDECFQCMDCVVIYGSDKKCAPLIMEVKRARTIAIVRAINS
ncbi:4Fe-4S binding protein [Massilia sp. TWR1-2-2]|uniref:4Fe-4S binding protein n=1 Tax=Massilia sp. TWR1-2-2 TaxID=2804584 RepID=UPI003CF1C3F4